MALCWPEKYADHNVVYFDIEVGFGRLLHGARRGRCQARRVCVPSGSRCSGSPSAGRPPRVIVYSMHDLEQRSCDESKKFSCAWPPLSCQNFPLSCRLILSERKLASMTVSSPNVIEIKLDRLIDDMRLLRSQMIAFDKQLKGIEAHLKPSEPSEQHPRSKSRPWFAALAIATAKTVLFAVGAATGAALLYLGTSADSATAISASMSLQP